MEAPCLYSQLTPRPQLPKGTKVSTIPLNPKTNANFETGVKEFTLPDGNVVRVTVKGGSITAELVLNDHAEATR